MVTFPIIQSVITLSFFFFILLVGVFILYVPLVFFNQLHFLIKRIYAKNYLKIRTNTEENFWLRILPRKLLLTIYFNHLYIIFYNFLIYVQFFHITQCYKNIKNRQYLEQTLVYYSSFLCTHHNSEMFEMATHL